MDFTNNTMTQPTHTPNSRQNTPKINFKDVSHILPVWFEDMRMRIDDVREEVENKEVYEPVV
jgi:hypothetical protein